MLMQLPQTKTIDLLGTKIMEDEYKKLNNDDHNDRPQISAGSSMAELTALLQSNRQSVLSSAAYADILRGRSSMAQQGHPSTSTMSSLLGSNPSSSLYSTTASSLLADRLGASTSSFLNSSSAATTSFPSSYTSGYNTSSYPSSLSSMSMPSSSMALYRASLPSTTTTAAASMYPSSLATTNMMAAQNNMSMSSSLSPSVQYELALQSAMARTSAYHNAYSSLSNEELLATNRLDASQSYLAASAAANNNNIVPSLPPLGGNNPMMSSSSYTAHNLSSLNPTTARMLGEASSAASSSMLGNRINSNHSYTLGTSSSSKNNNNATATSPKASLGSRQSSDNSELPLHSQYNKPMGMSNNNDMNHPVRLVIPTDTMFLDSVHIFLRCHCIEIFVASPEDMTYPGKCRKKRKDYILCHMMCS